MNVFSRRHKLLKLQFNFNAVKTFILNILNSVKGADGEGVRQGDDPPGPPPRHQFHGTHYRTQVHLSQKSQTNYLFIFGFFSGIMISHLTLNRLLPTNDDNF